MSNLQTQPGRTPTLSTSHSRTGIHLNLHLRVQICMASLSGARPESRVQLLHHT